LLKNIKVLLIEDEKNLSLLLKEAIENNFESFIIANNAKEGFEYFLKYTPNLIISDIVLPDLNGLELVKKIKQINSEIPIIMISAYSEKEKLLSAIEIGVKKYFIKPFDPDEMLEFIKSLNLTPKKIINLVDNFKYNLQTHSLYKDDKFIKLTNRERVFLNLLISKKNFIVNKDDLKKLWENEISDEVIRTFIKRFRQKTSKNLILNIKNQGYLFK